MRRFLSILLLVGGVSACSPEQHRAWMRWFRQEPKAATRWAVEECGDLCTLDWDRDGVVEPEPAADGGWTDITTDEDIFDVPDVEGGQDTGGVYEPWISLAECESGGDWSVGHGQRLLWRTPVRVGVMGSGRRIRQPGPRLTVGAGHAGRDVAGLAGLECVADLRPDRRADLGGRQTA